MSDDNTQLRERLKILVPINELPENLQNQIFERANVLEVKKSRFIFKQGDKDAYSYYLLEGEVELHTGKEINSVIESNSDRARYALAQLQPRQFSAKAKTPLKILQVERNILDQMMVLAQEKATDDVLGSGSGSVEVDEVDGVDDDTDWMTQMLQSELFSKMPMANIHQLFALLEPVEFKAGDVVVEQGSVGENYYIISEGRCAVSRRPSPKSNDVKLAELKTGDSFGEEALISESTRNATVTMITDGVLMQLAKDTFVELVKKPTMQSLDYDEADALVNEGSAKWLDVRFPNEHKESAIAGSLNIPLNSLRLQLDKLDPEIIYVLYCDTGARSSTGMFLLVERGFQVSYLEGGLVNNPEATGVQTAESTPPEPVKETVKPEPKPEPAPAKQAEDEQMKVNAEAEAKKKAQEESQRKEAEAEAKKKAEEDEVKLKKLEAENQKKMEAEKKKLEEIYNKNAQDMEKLQKAKEVAQEKLRKEREAIEKQAEKARKQIEEAKQLKEKAAEVAKKQLEQAEAAKKKLEEDAKKKQLEEEERERRLQEEVKAKIEEERKKMAEEYARSSKEMEELQRERERAAVEAAEAAKAAAKEEAQKMIDEYKQSHDKERAEAEAKLKAEREKLEEEARKIQESMKQIQQARLEAESAKEEAMAEAKQLKEKQMDSTSSKKDREKLEVEIKVAEEKLVEAEREIEDVEHREKLTVSAQEVNEADLAKKKQQEEALRAQIEGDLQDFEETQEEEKASITQIQMQADMMKRIKAKAAEAKKKAASANENLLSEISKQLGDK